ncbi:MAG: hypothetical protein HY736_05745 [Verrucomicrobia bacterium]|nr:hypothetical protein [Verrucomicrobiota bacterium]
MKHHDLVKTSALLLAICIFSALALSACGHLGDHPKGEHPKAEHPKAEHPKKETPKSNAPSPSP